MIRRNCSPMTEANLSQHLYRTLYRIRRFEETVLEKFPSGVFFGTTHTCLGQEANAVGVLAHLRPEDIVFSNHRGHGHYLAYGGDMRALFAELMGRATGVCGGRGGSQHLHWRNFYSNGVQGGIVPIATGMALAEKRKGSQAIVFAFLGDGTLGEGVLYEALNLASLWRAPLLFVLENNHIAQTTPVELALAGDIAARFQAFGIPCTELDTSDVVPISAAAQELLARLRSGDCPQALLLHTQRFGPHSKGDDTRRPQEIENLKRQHDPLPIQATRLTPEMVAQIQAEVDAEISGETAEKVLEHFRNPRNVGVIPDADGVGEVGSLACGDALKLTFKLDETKTHIIDAKFQTFGCASAIASSSALTEMIKGKTLEEAEKITNQDIAEYLGGLPEQKMHCSVMGREALQLAIQNYRTGKTGKELMKGKVVCHCFGITEDFLIEVIKENHLATIEQVTNYCKAGGACGKCHEDIARIIQMVLSKEEKVEQKQEKKPLTMIQKIKLIEDTLQKEVRPLLAKDGGDVELIDVAGNTVKVALRGMCANCIGARVTLRDVVEAKLKEFVSKDIAVEEAE